MKKQRPHLGKKTCRAIAMDDEGSARARKTAEEEVEEASFQLFLCTTLLIIPLCILMKDPLDFSIGDALKRAILGRIETKYTAWP